ncbi:YpjP family protein [Pontibacillus litoralis]|uniref:Cell division protein FtsK n=1 Tax=Pontibacillus litoralis JSM 072002 TaxID=1385512 RepID=A0A0A5FVS1_9BACI|nr:YpjP family protein [Pontibacillus litoralis]KGX84896.1 hypothetical protein N784_11555 [Pontibacillus litoralis JSM 072002]
MKRWLIKSFVTLVTILTLGLYIPPYSIDTSAAEDKEPSSSNKGIDDIQSGTTHTTVFDNIPPSSEEVVHVRSTDAYIQDLTEKAKEQTVTKMGPRIMDKLEDDMTALILPSIEVVVKQLIKTENEASIPYYEITEQPSAGYGEKMFHLYNKRTNEEMARFHVRRDKRPGEGYWFNFHYHMREDNFLEHHPIGDIYWDKNTPPKWMAM